MKKIVILIILILCVGCSQTEERVINVLNWSSYIPNEVIENFEKETGIKVNYSTYSSNEELLAKVSSAKIGTYDLIFPSDYMIEIMRSRDILDKIDSCQPCHFTAKKKNSLEDAHYTIQALEVAGDVLYEYLDDDKKEMYENADEYIEKEIAAQERRIARLEKKQAEVQYGIIAQEVEEIFPECVSVDSNGYYSVDYSKFGLYAIEGIKELHKKVKDLECENETLQAKNEELELRLAAIEAKLGL